MRKSLKKIKLIVMLVCVMAVLAACSKKEAGYYKYSSVVDKTGELGTFELAMIKLFSEDMFLILDSDGTGYMNIEMLGEGGGGEITWEDNTMSANGGKKIEFEYNEDTEELTFVSEDSNIIFRKTKDEAEINRMKSKRK